jgi:hypothetical protein
MPSSGIAPNVANWWRAESFNYKALWKTCPKRLPRFMTRATLTANVRTAALFMLGEIGHLGINFVGKVS